MDNKTKIDRLHDLLPKFLHSRTNTNWKALVDAIGDEDEKLGQLITEVRKQFFVKSSSRPYIDVLAANNNISRPRLVGMTDASFRNYIPVLSYQPKQVKLIIDALLDIFFFKESTTAFLTTTNFEPFSLLDSWDLQLRIDGVNVESIRFNAADFTDITDATANEVVAAYNRQAKYSYATAFYDSITKHSYIRIFTVTVGSKGSIEILGGLANIGLMLNGFIANAGTGGNTQWTVTKVGDTTTFTHTGGASPGLNFLQVGDILISNLSGNVGSFPITSIDISTNKITFTNLFSTTGVFTQVSDRETKFVRPDKYVAYKQPRRAITWETTSGEVTVEMPTTPPVVTRSLKGSMHLDGVFSLMTNRDSDTSLTITNAAGFPKAGNFIIEHVDAITARIVTSDVNEVVTTTFNGRLIHDVPRYHYTSRVVLNTTGTSTENSKQITVASVAGLVIGNTIFMEGFREDAVITDIVGLVITSSIPSTLSLTGASISFGNNTLTGITPNLPELSSLDENILSSLTRAGGVVTATTSVAHDYNVGQAVNVRGSSGINFLITTGNVSSGSNTLTGLVSTIGVSPGQTIVATGVPIDTYVQLVLSPTSVLMTRLATATAIATSIQFNETLNGSFAIESVTSTQFTYSLTGSNGSAVTAGTSSVENIGLSNTNSKILLTTAQLASNTRITGTYVWDLAAPFVLSSATALTQDEIIAGKIVRLLNVGSNEIPNQMGFIIFDYGLNTQEGPVKYLYKPADNILALDPSYIFTQDHDVGSSLVVISHKGPHVMDGLASEYAPYITDPSAARVILENLIKSVVSAGIFVNFLVRFPIQLYGTLDVYNSGTLPPV